MEWGEAAAVRGACAQVLARIVPASVAAMLDGLRDKDPAEYRRVTRALKHMARQAESALKQGRDLLATSAQGIDRS